MIEAYTPAATERVIGRYGEPNGDGPLLIVVAGLHGNEPMGCIAAERILQRIATEAPPFRGHLLVLSGNVAALRQQRRYVDLDLNRIWDDATMASKRAGELDNDIVEYQEQALLLSLLEEAFTAFPGPATILDLHTSSSPSAPFGIVGESEANRRFARALQIPVPLVYGLDAQFDGPLLKYLGKRGHRTLAFEAGQHEDPQAIVLHEAVILKLLVSCGLLEASSVSTMAERNRALIEASGKIPHHLEVFYRHAIAPEDEFVMKPGFCNFGAVAEGGELATERGGAVVAPESCRVLLPLYQKQGNDGFFLVRELPEEPLS